MTYKQALTQEMDRLAKNPKVRFVGYNTTYGPRMNKTLCNVPISQCIEMPVAENLMCGVAMGLALEGFLPVLCFERFDFCLTCADALFNHIGGMQHYGLVLPMIIRVCIGSDSPLDPGVQHKQDYTSMFRMYSGIDVREFSGEYPSEIDHPIMIVERKSLYETDINTKVV